MLVRRLRLRSALSSTALLAVTLTGLEAGAALTGGGAVAMAGTLDDPPPAEGEPPAEEAPPPGREPAPDDGPFPGVDPESPPPGWQRFEPPPDEESDVPAEPVPGEQAPAEPAPEEEVPAAPVAPAPEPAIAPPAPRPGTGPAILGPGMKGLKVQKLQVRLQRLGLYDIPVTGLYGKQTTRAVKRFQGQLGYARSGRVDQATFKEIWLRGGKVGRPAIAAGENRPYGSRLAGSCLTGNVVCVDKTGRTVRWVVDGKVRMTLDARFGGSGTETREGVFSIYWKSRDHHSRLYDTDMPFAMFFAGGQAVHYSPDFASRGYSGASHGCVNTREYGKMRRLFDLASVGDRVVVYRSRPLKG